jgi:hypothetical protein
MDRMPGARRFVQDCLKAMGQVATPEVIDAVALEVCRAFRFLDGKTVPKFDCGYDGCALNTTVPHWHE